MKTSESSTDRMLAIAAMVVASLALFWPRLKPSSPVREETVPAEAMASLPERVKQLEGRPVSTANETAPEAASDDGVTIRQVHEWVWGLEQRLVQLEHGVADLRAGSKTPRSPTPDIAQAREVALNPAAPAADRLAGLRALRAADARSSDIVQEMLKLQATAEDPGIRADVFRQLSGVADPIMKPHLINGMLKDPDARVREEAAETLAPFWPDPYVQSALQSVAQNDPDQRVREQALETVRKRGR